ncbi:MAG: lysophospholipid acyltransferase family protein [Lachnospiraceae bacterium]
MTCNPLRTILCLIWLVIFFAASLVLLPVAALIGHFSQDKKDAFCYPVVRAGLKVLWHLAGVKPQITGMENIPKDQPVLYVGNHRSFFDIIILASILPGKLSVVAKKEMEHIPLLSTWMRDIHCLFLDRSNLRAGAQMMLDGIDLMKNGISVLIFPEGTRNKGDGILDFKGGSFKLATKPGFPIVPVVQTGTREMFEDLKPFGVKAAKTTVTILPAIQTAGIPRAEQNQLHVKVHDDMVKVFNSLQK